MFMFSCKRCVNLRYYENVIKLVNAKSFNTRAVGYSHNVSRFISNKSTNFESKDPFESVNLTYEKVESDSDVYDEDEYLYPESLNSISNLPLHNVISHSSGLKNEDLENDANSDDLSDVIANNVSDIDLKIRNTEIAQFLERALRDQVNPKCSVSLFGSAINGLWTEGSDLDVCVEIPNVNSRSAVIRNLRRIATVLSPLSPTRVIQNRFTAKIPILNWRRDSKKRPVKIVEESLNKQEILDFECESIPSIDISVNNVLAVANSILVGSYVSFEPRVRGLILLLKMWAKSKGINDRSRGTLSSFAISLMVIHFLQNCSPPLLPSLQDLAFSTNEPPNYVAGVDCRFSTDMNKIRAELNFLSKGKANTLDDRTLLINFFRYYGWYNLHSQGKPILIRSVDLSEFNMRLGTDTEDPDANLEKSTLGGPYLHVDNPFEIGIDVANISIHQRSRITNEFRKAYQTLRAGSTLKSLLSKS
ncbi:uncharacterized protein TOT_040000837 [Theileria orientalis strain Shintoku]|uniref:Poly(A) RNA polymerase mitochondrial-like central palm domain-containing protein n=1 Tax=Theileria orientalis strain Shintoku TaxID=869250 RepID=J7M4S4_THEOR|nr:uncharacterized protein TOT_040000837 [Theileria orientalis strain Shintoku]PVC49444.1 hypothetical protein MACL_00002991 [Theileria orientalis]BAM42470.1 uncharacterized protein TOT_040000837 [Theileria orientalis strain Shintoku]|eukprot:XP_009692771.1 uncharacterized protein TOT_040000837 [Theileria orientalis strain Shintoku]